MLKHTLFALGIGATLASCVAEPGETSELTAELGTTTTYYAGGTRAITPTMSSELNDAGWLVNMSDGVWGDVTKLTATLHHGGFLANTYTGMDHIAVGIRGASHDAGLMQMNWPVASRFLFGEELRPLGGTNPALLNMIAGRGITFWPAGSTYCVDRSRPCAIFENYTVNAAKSRGEPEQDGLVCRYNRFNCGTVALPLTSASFQVRLTADDYDVRTVISQNGVTLANVSCRALTSSWTPGGDSRCGAQAADVALGDAFIANVIGAVPVARTVGATGITVSVGPYTSDQPPCPTCPIP